MRKYHTQTWSGSWNFSPCLGFYKEIMIKIKRKSLCFVCWWCIHKHNTCITLITQTNIPRHYEKKYIKCFRRWTRNRHRMIRLLGQVMGVCWEHLKMALTDWGRVTHICVSKLTIIGSDNGLLPGRRQAIICTNDGILLIGALGINLSEIKHFHSEKIVWKCCLWNGGHFV